MTGVAEKVDYADAVEVVDEPTDEEVGYVDAEVLDYGVAEEVGYADAEIVDELPRDEESVLAETSAKSVGKKKHKTVDVTVRVTPVAKHENKPKKASKEPVVTKAATNKNKIKKARG
jgi:hypothetical protein